MDELEDFLRASRNEWRFRVYQAIGRIRRGYVATYGHIARQVNRMHGLRINARNVAWLRGKLYNRLGHHSDVPLHRVAKQGDAESEWDLPTTKKANRRLRLAEGSWPQPRWLDA